MFVFRYEDYPNDLRLKCFEFFYWFSRFEFALKENGYVKEGSYHAALPEWEKFRDTHSDNYITSPEASTLLEAPPQRQVLVGNTCKWEKTNLSREKTTLGKVILVLKTIRNNLFHGGKSSQEDWDNPDRNLFLLENGKAVLDSLANSDGLQADYERHY